MDCHTWGSQTCLIEPGSMPLRCRSIISSRNGVLGGFDMGVNSIQAHTDDLCFGRVRPHIVRSEQNLKGSQISLGIRYLR
jgi:hypothetical protein